MANKVYLDDEGIIVIEVIGDQTVDSVNAMGADIEELIKRRRAAKAPCLVLDNLLQMGAVGGDARDAVVHLAKVLDYDKAVMVGRGGGLMRIGANLMLRATGRGNTIRYFEDMEDARRWLIVQHAA